MYLAEQTEPVHRNVALKIVKLGMDTHQVVARFEAERQALAMMDHPHIAKVFDAGATDSGRPYFAMEHVPGASLTRFCDQEQLGEQIMGALGVRRYHHSPMFVGDEHGLFVLAPVGRPWIPERVKAAAVFPAEVTVAGHGRHSLECDGHP